MSTSGGSSVSLARLTKLMEQLADDAPQTLVPQDLIDDPLWQQIREQAKITLEALEEKGSLRGAQVASDGRGERPGNLRDVRVSLRRTSPVQCARAAIGRSVNTPIPLQTCFFIE
jgi:hypothetical protein